MTVEPLKGRGASRARAVCDDCGRRTDAIACRYKSNGKNPLPNEAEVISKAIRLGWAFVKGKLRCVGCEAKRKAENMRSNKNGQVLGASKPPVGITSEVKADLRTPTKKQRLEIISMLMEVYDLDAERYTGGDTDDTVASVLSVMPGWVAKIREAEFGPDGGNENIETLKVELEEHRKQLQGHIQANTTRGEKLIVLLERAKCMSDDLAKIKKSVGAHVLKRAGV